MATILTTVATYVVICMLGAVLGAAGYVIFRQRALKANQLRIKEQARLAIQAAEREADTLVKEAKLEAKAMLLQAKAELEKEQKIKHSESVAQEKRLLQREELLDRRSVRWRSAKPRCKNAKA